MEDLIYNGKYSGCHTQYVERVRNSVHNFRSLVSRVARIAEGFSFSQCSQELLNV